MLPPKSKIINLANWNERKKVHGLKIPLYDSDDASDNKAKLEEQFVFTLETKLFLRLVQAVLNSY